MGIGGFIGGLTLKKPVADVPEIWVKRFGPAGGNGISTTFFGGVLILFASRLAGGCTLGLFLSGSSQLALSGLYFGVLIFALAMLSARMLYGRLLVSATSNPPSKERSS